MSESVQVKANLIEFDPPTLARLIVARDDAVLGKLYLAYDLPYDSAKSSYASFLHDAISNHRREVVEFLLDKDKNLVDLVYPGNINLSCF